MQAVLANLRLDSRYAAPAPSACSPSVPAVLEASRGSRRRQPGRAALQTRASWQTERERELARNVPPAPPARVPPPPPPPPPPAPEPIVENDLNISRRALFGIMVGGTALWYAALRGGYPLTTVDKQKNVALLKTKGGNLVAATQDSAGRIFMFDAAGNLYYDTEDPRTGMYVVDTAGDMFNQFVDKNGKVVRVPVGNIGDLRSITVEEVGGVPIRELQRSIKGLRGGRVTGFVQRADPREVFDLMPPNAPAGANMDRTRIEPPPFLEDIEVDLQPKGGLGGLFGGGSPDSSSPAATLRSLQRGDK
ncbi:hypothetical protein C2E20_4174 [Micractinium conductrix]|uniref:Uncharacterized protein n=1 Tax=Micractinium conductrix TaxID=554055 RepID=A0A2P6VER6_9CHLO|nr:hypothetical protein C2E20_4174 [Micractinium conductrix]|eukprot:PSC72567.1 hypothetical protein C2E20_4174 [Micractinium conductrix]